eukprot:gene4303-20503_t
MADVRDILEIEGSPQTPTSKNTIIHGNKQKRLRRTTDTVFKRPEGMHRELYALLYSDQRDPSSMTPSDTGRGYKQVKAKIGRSKVRSWQWEAFKNPSRKDDLEMHHWRRKNDEGKAYPFAKFNKVVEIPSYTDEEYKLYLEDKKNSWTKDETDHLLDLCRRFDLRFVVINDRYDRVAFKKRSMEELKGRYYDLVGRLFKVQAQPGKEHDSEPPVFDAEHEAKRKEQLLKLYNRTPEQVEEEDMLVSEQKKIESRKKEREKKQLELNKLITAAEKKPQMSEHKVFSSGKDKKQGKKKQKRKSDQQVLEVKQKTTEQLAGIRFPESKGAGSYLRSSKLKMPQSVGTKKAKAVEQLLDGLGVELYPMPTEKIVLEFNELRNDLLLLYELKQALGNCEFELQTLKHKFELLAPNKDITPLIGFSLSSTSQTEVQDGNSSLLIDVVAAGNLRKRRTATTFLETTPWKKSRK